MILVTVGTQMPFPRLVSAIDRIAAVLGEQIVAQIGPDPGQYPNLETHAILEPAVFQARFLESRLVVAHAGIGTVLSAIRYEKPLVMMPRQHALGEHRNDHQAATAKALQGREGLYLCWGEDDLSILLESRQLLNPMRNDSRPRATDLNRFISAWLAEK